MPFIFSFITFLSVRFSLKYSLIVIYLTLTLAVSAVVITSFGFALSALLTVYNLVSTLLTSLNFSDVASTYSSVASNFLSGVGFYQGLQVFTDLVLSALLALFTTFAFKLILSFLSYIKYDIANIAKML